MEAILRRTRSFLAFFCLLAIQTIASAATIDLPVCNFPPCNNDLIFNFDFTNPLQSPPPPYVLMELLIPVNVIDSSAAIHVDVFSGLDGTTDASGSSSSFIGGVSSGPQTLSFLLTSGGPFDGQLDGIFSIGLNSAGTIGPAIELTSFPQAQGSAGTCFIGSPSPDCFTVTIAGVQPPAVPEPDTILLLLSGLLLLSIRLRTVTKGASFSCSATS